MQYIYIANCGEFNHYTWSISANIEVMFLVRQTSSAVLFCTNSKRITTVQQNVFCK